MNNFQTRTITGLTMVFILLAAIWFSGWVFACIFLVVTILGLREFYTLITGDQLQPQMYFGIATGIIMYLLFFAGIYFFPEDPVSSRMRLTLFIIPFILTGFSFIIELYRKKSNPAGNVAVTLLGVLYVALPFSLLLFFSYPGVESYAGMPVILVGYFGFTWIYDTAAYLFGRQFGKHKLFERISPKKTWEGTVAGALVTLIIAVIPVACGIGMPWFDWFALAAMVVVFGTLGDLAESMFKRSLHVKDSGTLLPGHGGILDRFDTILISAPFVFLYFFSRNLI